MTRCADCNRRIGKAHDYVLMQAGGASGVYPIGPVCAAKRLGLVKVGPRKKAPNILSRRAFRNVADERQIDWVQEAVA